MVSSFVDSRRVSLRDNLRDTLRGANGVDSLKYFSFAQFDASPSAQEVFVNGVAGNRLFIPSNSLVIGSARFVAWNTTANTAAACGYAMFNFVAQNAAGTVSLPANLLLAAGGNPVRIAGQAGVLGANINVVADDTNKSVNVVYTGTANQNYMIRGTIDIVFCDASAREFSNFFTAIT